MYSKILTNILFKYDTVTFGFLSGREWPQKRPIIYEFLHGIWISSRFVWRHIFLTVCMTSYFCDVILTTLLWRHIFVTSFWRRYYDVIFLWRQFDDVIMTSYSFDVILTTLLWRHIFVTSFYHRHWKRHATEKCIIRSWICSFHLPCAEAFACCWKPVVVISSFYVGLHFVVWKWRENQSRMNRNQNHGSTSRETARALEPLNSTSENKRGIRAYMHPLLLRSIDMMLWLYTFHFYYYFRSPHMSITVI
jgi:hypothetical protein